MSAQPARRQPSAMPLTMATPIFGAELAGGEIVEEEQRLGALDDDVVDAHRDEIDADRVVDAGLDGDLHLGADAVIGGDEDRVLETGRLEIEQAAEAADLRVGAGPPGGAHEGLDRVHHGVAGVDVDAGFAHRSGRCAWHPSSNRFLMALAGVRRGASGRKRRRPPSQ